MYNLITAVSSNLVIGRNNGLPWKLSDDLKRFKRLTDGHVVIMGRLTADSLVSPLANRVNIVITSKDYERDGFEFTNSIDKAIEFCKTFHPDKQIFFIGGRGIYDEVLKKGLVKTLYITVINRIVEGDVFFPSIDHGNYKLEESELRTFGQSDSLVGVDKTFPIAYVFEKYSKLE